MEEQLAYALITPYSIRKSRTGGILSRLLSRTALDLVGAYLFAPSAELAEAYAQSAVREEKNQRHRETQVWIEEYIKKNLPPAPNGQRERALLLVFKGVNAVNKVMDVVGHIVHERTTGETIRDTYGDFIAGEEGKAPKYFEPAVLAAPTAEAVQCDLMLFAKHSDADGGLLDRFFPASEKSEGQMEKTLVLIKPDNFRFPNARPGAVMDLFSRTGLTIIGFKILHMSVAQAEQFYGPVLEVLQDKLKGPTGARARLAIERELGFELTPEIELRLGELLGPVNGRHNWETIIQFMSGRRPDNCATEEHSALGTEKCIAIVYQGVDAVRKIRDVLGPTDPSKAPPGSIRKEFGINIMVNAAHASDSKENAEREMGIIKIKENNFRPIIENFYQGK